MEADEDPTNRTLSGREKDRIDRNRAKAKALRAARVIRPYPVVDKSSNFADAKKDSGGGYLLDENEEREAPASRVAEDPLLYLGDDQPICKECCTPFAESQLLTHFRYNICDNCRDNEGKHSMIARTTAKEEFLLKDHDLDERPSALPFIERRNPHARFGSMKLYLKCQVEERAIAIWGSAEDLEKEREGRLAQRVDRKQKKQEKDLKALRKSVLSKGKERRPHQHHYPPDSEVYDKDEDNYTKTCATCGHSVTFEKM